MRKRSTHLLGLAKGRSHDGPDEPVVPRGHSAKIIHWPTSESTRDQTNPLGARSVRARTPDSFVSGAGAGAGAAGALAPAIATSRGADSDGTAGTACGGESRTAQQRPTEKGQTGGGPVANICTLPAGRPRPLSSPGRVLCNKSGERSVLVRVGHPCCYSAICVDG